MISGNLPLGVAGSQVDPRPLFHQTAGEESHDPFSPSVALWRAGKKYAMHGES